MLTRAARPPADVRDLFRDLFREHYAFVWHTVRRFGVPQMSADDAVQDTFVTAFRRRRDFDGRSARAWLYSIGRRVASNHRRARTRADRRHHDAAVLRSPPRAEDELVLAEATVSAFLGELSAADRELFVLSEVDGLSGPELVQVLERKLPTLYARVRTLRQRFEAFVEHDAANARELLQRSKRALPRPTAAAWAAVLPRLDGSGAATTATGPGLLASLKTAFAGYAVGGVGAAGVLLAIATVNAGGEKPSVERSAIQGARELPAPEAIGAQGPVEVVQEAVEPPGPPVGVATDVGAARTGAGAGSPAAVRHGAPQPQRGAAPPDLEADTRLLRRASQALRAGEAETSLEHLSEHASRFAASRQADLRAALRIEALCALHRDAEAKVVWKDLLEQRPTSPVTKRVRASCVSQP